MMLPGTTSASFGRPMGLAGRAMMFTTFLLLITAVAAVVTIWLGAERENARNQREVAHDLATRFAETMANLIVSGNAAVLPDLIEEMSRREGMRYLALYNAEGQVIAESGDIDGREFAEPLQAAARGAGQTQSVRRSDGVLAASAPLILGAEAVGAATVVWNPGEFRFNAMSALAPFLVFLACLLALALPLARYVVKRAIAPLEELTAFAKRVSLSGEAPPLTLRTGDEFETLATAFNQMIARLDASMKRIQEIAYVDPVTQLPNAERFLRELDFNARMSGEGESSAVMVFEFQRLTGLLPTLDQEAARDLMRCIGDRFTAAARAVDRAHRTRGRGERPLVLARLSAIEFAAQTPEVESAAAATRLSQHLNAALNQPFDWRGHKISLGAACGVVLCSGDMGDADAVVRRARMAVSAAARLPGRVKLFTASLDRQAVGRVMLEREMRAALERNEFRAFFQPKINLATGRIEAAEALARWVRPDRTIVGPARFIPLAEETALIGPLSDAILREACWKAAAWARAGTPVSVAVNVSALQFQDERFAGRVLKVIEHAGLPAAALELEITESVAMAEPERALKTIDALRAAGVRFAIDDFGCGHSSLAALSKIPFDVVKIDQQFVRGLERDQSQAVAIIEMILALAGALSLDVVAEGVERRDQLEFLRARGCRWAQGFLYGAAVSAADFSELLRRQAESEGAGARAA